VVADGVAHHLVDGLVSEANEISEELSFIHCCRRLSTPPGTSPQCVSAEPNGHLGDTI
jgi:hypothetical protein